MAEDWLREQAVLARRETVFELSLQVREELMVRQRSELEARIVYDCALSLRASRFGFVVSTQADLELIVRCELFWPASGQRHHRCSSETCEIFNIPRGAMLQRVGESSNFIESTGAWYVCMSTGKMHECLPGSMCSAVKIVKDKEIGVTASYSCSISNLLKPVPKSMGSAWNGTTFYSRNVLRDIENRQDNAEFDDIGGRDESELEDDDDAAESLISDEESGEGDDKVAVEVDDVEDEHLAKRQRIDTTHVNNDATPFSTVRARYGDTLQLDELASAIAEERYEEHQHLLEKQRHDRERAHKNSNVISFGPSNGNWEMQKRLYKVRNMTSLLREKEKGRGDQPKRRNPRREIITRTSEEKAQRCMAKASSSTINQLLEALTSSSVRDGIMRCKLRSAVAAADLAVFELRQRYQQLPIIAQIGVWCEHMSTLPGLWLQPCIESEHDATVCAEIIMAHWKLASQSPYVTEALDVHKKKKRKPLDFLLYSIGILYMMARGGEAYCVKLTGALPTVTQCMPSTFLAKLQRGIVVKELPDLSATLNLLKFDMLPYLARVYRDDWLFTENTVNDGIQLVKQCWESRYRAEQDRLFTALKTMEVTSGQHTDTETQQQIGQCYRSYLQALVPAHSANRQWPTSTL